MIELQLIGHLGKDAEVKEIGNTKVINFSVAVTERFKNQKGELVENTTWVDVAKWGTNVTVAQYLKKGTQVYISGKPSARGYISNGSNEANGVLCVTAFNIKLLGSAQERKIEQKTPISDGDKLPF